MAARALQSDTVEDTADMVVVEAVVAYTHIVDENAEDIGLVVVA